MEQLNWYILTSSGDADNTCSAISVVGITGNISLLVVGITGNISLLGNNNGS